MSVDTKLENDLFEEHKPLPPTGKARGKHSRKIIRENSSHNIHHSKSSSRNEKRDSERS